MSSYFSKRFFSYALLIPLLVPLFANLVIASVEKKEKAVEQQQKLQLQEVETRWVQLQPKVITSIQKAPISADPILQALLTYAADMVAPYDITLAAVDIALEYHAKNNTLSCAEVMRNYKQALITGTVVIPQDQEDKYITRSLRERCFPGIRTRLLRANRICTLELGAINATFNSITVNETISGTINPASLCSGGVVTFPCNVQFNSNNNTLNAVGNSVEPVLNLIRGTIAPNLTATVVEEPFRQVTIANAPTIIAGAGFTVAATPSITVIGQEIALGTIIGTINVTFDPTVQYVSRPSITLGVENAPGNTTQAFDYRVTNVTTTGFSIEIISLSTIVIDDGLILLAGSINFMAAGPTVG